MNVSVSNLVKKTDYDTKISELEKKLTDHKYDKYITTPEFNKLTAESFAARLAKANLVTKTDLDAKLSSLNIKIVSNKTKHLIVQSQLKKLETFDSVYFRGKSHFEDDGTQNYLVFQPIYKYFEITPTTNTILSWKSTGLSDETIKPPRPHTVLDRELSYVGNKTRVNLMEAV